MIEYACNRCGKIFNKKSNYDNHVYKRKKQCVKCSTFKCNLCSKCYNHKSGLYRHMNKHKPDHKKNDEKTIDALKCRKCKKTYSTTNNLKRHMKACNIQIYEDNSIVNDLKKEMDDLREELKNIKQNSGHTTNNVYNNININNTYNILNIGNEDMSYINDEEWKRIMRKGVRSIPELVKCVHFDKSNPQNHNVYIPNLSQPYAIKYDNGEWIIAHRDEVIDELCDVKEKHVIEKYYEFLDNDNLDDQTIRRMRRYEEDIDTDLVHIKNRHDVKLILLNYKNIPINTRNSIKK